MDYTGRAEWQRARAGGEDVQRCTLFLFPLRVSALKAKMPAWPASARAEWVEVFLRVCEWVCVCACLCVPMHVCVCVCEQDDARIEVETGIFMLLYNNKGHIKQRPKESCPLPPVPS